jgi:hypothetical protein
MLDIPLMDMHGPKNRPRFLPDEAMDAIAEMSSEESQRFFEIQGQENQDFNCRACYI